MRNKRVIKAKKKAALSLWSAILDLKLVPKLFGTVSITVTQGTNHDTRNINYRIYSNNRRTCGAKNLISGAALIRVNTVTEKMTKSAAVKVFVCS